MKNKIVSKSVFIFGVLFTALFLSACSDFSKSSGSSDGGASDGGRAFLSLSVIQNSSFSRGTINPKNVSESDISRVLLEARPYVADENLDGGTSASQDQAFTVKEWFSSEEETAISIMQRDTDISIENGTYTFRLILYTSENSSASGISADGSSGDETNELIYRPVQEGEIANKTVKGGINPLIFRTSYVKKGDLSVRLNFSQDKRIGLVKAGLFTLESNGSQALVSSLDGTVYDFETIAEASLNSVGADSGATSGTTGSAGTGSSSGSSGSTGTGGSVSTEYLTSALYSKKNIPNGTYFIKFAVYGSDKTTRLNSLMDIVKINGWKTIEERELLDVNTLYNISYQLNGGSWSDGVEVNLKKTRNANTGVQLPTALTKEGYAFAGWYLDSGFTQKIERIGTGEENAKDFVLYAKWIKAEYYVSGTGDDTEGDGSQENPFESVDRACQEIIENGSPLADWKIYIVGDVTGPHEGTNKAGNRSYTKDYGRTVIPAELTSAHAKSLLITGASDLDSDGLPQDLLNRGLNPGNTTHASDTGTVLIVESEVPVTIKNLKITNSNNNQSNGSTETFNRKGGGLAISSVSTVKLSDGVWITNNKGYYGGGIYNAGSLYIYGSAVIGNRSQEERANQSAANSSEDGGGIYNEGNLYLGYSEYKDEENNTEEEWTGCINYNYSWRGGAINNRGSGVILFRDGTIAHNDTVHGGGSGGGAGIYNYGSVVMTGGVIEYNYEGGNSGGAGLWNGSSSTYGTGTFIFSGGKIQKNEAGSGNNGENGGGGVYNNGIMYVYGNAIIGDEDADQIADAENCSNISAGRGAGIFVAQSGALYLGYSSYIDSSNNSPAKWNKGIYYNYSKTSGGGLAFVNGATIIFNSGIIANNGAEKAGGAVSLSGDGMILSGSASIPAGNSDVKQSLYFENNSYHINIDNDLSHLDSIYLIPKDNSSSSSAATGYSTYKPIVQLTETASGAGLTIADIKEKFTIEPFTSPVTGIVTNWELADDGKVQQCIESLTVSATGEANTYPSISDAIDRINELNEPEKDYVITLYGEINGPQIIEDPAAGTIKANTITILAKNTSVSSSLTDIINASLEETALGSALSVKTSVPVILSGIKITGGHGSSITSGDNVRIAGGGLFLGEGATVSLENYSAVTGNTTYVSSSSTSATGTVGAGAGIYISDGAKLVMNYKTKVYSNVGTHYGAGIYVSEGGYLKTIAGSGSDIFDNSFDGRFAGSSGSTSTFAVKGGGIYLENNASLEQLGTFVRNNPVCNGELGSGIYMCSSANYMISGSAQVNAPNDVYMEENAQIEVVGSISEKPNACLTLASYPADTEEVYPVKIKENSGLSWSNSGIASHFEINPSTITSGDNLALQYWTLDTATGKLIKITGTDISVSIPSSFNNDIQVTVKSIHNVNGTTSEAVITDTVHLTGDSTLVFTASEGYRDYFWKLDGVGQSTPTENILTLYPAGESASGMAPWVKGTYVVYLEAIDSDDRIYSYTAQITVGE